MADDITVDNGGLTDFVVSTDEMDDGSHAQEVKILQSAATDGSRWTIDSSGALVNLGTNNDVTITSGTVTVGGTATVSVAGTATIAGALSAGTAVIGRVIPSAAGGTADQTWLSLTSATAAAVGLVDSTGAQVTFAAPVVFSVTAANTTSAYASADTIGTAITFSSASIGSGKTGHVISAVCYDPGDTAQDVYLWLFSSSVTPSADNAAFALSDADLAKTQGVIQFTDWFDAANGQVSIGKLTPVGHPLHYATSGGVNLYGVVQSQGTPTYAGGTTLAFELHCLKD